MTPAEQARAIVEARIGAEMNGEVLVTIRVADLRTIEEALSREEQVRAGERSAIVALFREMADHSSERASKAAVALQRERLEADAFMMRFHAQMIENGRHHMTMAEYCERFFPAFQSTPSSLEGGEALAQPAERE